MSRIWWLESECWNGGYCQLFYNKGVPFVRDAMDDMVALGMNSRVPIIERAIELEVQFEPHADDPRWVPLDCEYGNVQDQEPASLVLRQYFIRHPEQFTGTAVE